MKKIIQIQVLEKSIESLKYETNQKTASRAFLIAAESYQFNKDMIQTLKIEVRDLDYELQNLRKRFSAIDKACREVLEITGQEELL